MAERPHRIQARDFAGRTFTLGDGPQAWSFVGGAGKNLLLLGLGPGNPAELPFVATANDAEIYWINDPHMQNLCGKKQPSLPSEWHSANIKDEHFWKNCRIYFYRPGLRIAPDFWGPLLGKITADLIAKNFAPNPQSAWLPGNDCQLLHQELKLALTEYGFVNIYEQAPSQSSWQALAKAWGGSCPEFALSVNFRGLDSEGHIFNLCQALDIPLAVWLVDNPWHLLSGIKFPWWKKANIFVTDASFIAPLQKAGALHVSFCPLASSQHMWRNFQKPSCSSAPLFVGRASFPDHAKFFSGLRKHSGWQEEAAIMLQNAADNAALPDFHWWAAKYNLELWPGLFGRQAGYEADFCSAQNRMRWLKEAARCGLKLIGDDKWRQLLPNVVINPPVDYYNGLGEEYGQAECVLNVTSLLIPQSLNQRHFDVWSTGGFLLTDSTKGLDIFPAELTEPIALRAPEEYAGRLWELRANSGKKMELIQAWRDLLVNEHLYKHRIELMLTACKMAK